MNKLYVVTRADLPPGAQLAQSCHAVSAFAVLLPKEHREWHEHGQNLVVLAAPDLPSLEALFFELNVFDAAPFHEPDLGGTLTAFAVSDAATRRLSCLPLALRAPRALAAA